MASLTKRSRSDDIPQSKNPSLPEHILDHMILPHLSFKTLKRFQCVSKRYLSLIGDDPIFAFEQARLFSSSAINLVQFSGNGLFFLTNLKSIGIPDPSLKFLRKSSEIEALLCSTNGLLLFYCVDENANSMLCLCNPATQEKVYPPRGQFRSTYNMGLVFDPTITPNHFILVNVQLENEKYRNGYEFEIFRSDTGQWSKSNQIIIIDKYSDISNKMGHMQGVVYWHFDHFILWYNTHKDLAGFVPLPTTKGHWWMGFYEGGIVCCHTCANGVEVWRLANGTHWNICFCISWDNMPFQLDGTWLKVSQLYKIRKFRPLGFDGRFIYMLGFAKKRMYTVIGAFKMIILVYNILTKKIEEKREISMASFILYGHQAHDYHNNMAPLPKIL